jgi:hypothetical protein
MPATEPFALQQAESDVADDILASMRDQANAETAEARAFVESAAPALLSRCLDYGPEMDRLYRVFGREHAAWASSDLRSRLTDFLGLCDHRLAIIGQAEEFLRPWGVIDDAQENRLTMARDDIAAVRRQAVGFLSWLDAPPPPLDPEQLTATRAAYERGEYESVEDILRRLESGGVL